MYLGRAGIERSEISPKKKFTTENIISGTSKPPKSKNIKNPPLKLAFPVAVPVSLATTFATDFTKDEMPLDITCFRFENCPSSS